METVKEQDKKVSEEEKMKIKTERAIQNLKNLKTRDASISSASKLKIR